MRAQEFLFESRITTKVEGDDDSGYDVYGYVDGKPVGMATFVYDPDRRGWYSEATDVDPEYQRMGVATAIYNTAREKIGRIVPADDQTDDARALWKGKNIWEQQLNELADQPYKLQYAQHGAMKSVFGFETDSGAEYVVHVHPMRIGTGFQTNLLDVSFALLEDGEAIDTVTGPLKVFGTVLEAVKVSLAERTKQGLNIEYIRFTAKNMEPKRVALYTRMARNIGRYLPGWSYDTATQTEYTTSFIVKRTTELDEVEEIEYSKSKRRGFTGPRSLKALKSRFDIKQLLDLGKFSIWHESAGGISIYYVIDNRTQEAQIQLSGKERKNVISDLNLFAAPSNTIKAADFYRILITKLNKVLVGDRQSPGSQAVWAKLAKLPDVGVHGWLNGKPVNITPADREEAYATYRQGDPTIGQSPELKDAYKMKLVAHKVDK